MVAITVLVAALMTETVLEFEFVSIHACAVGADGGSDRQASDRNSGYHRIGCGADDRNGIAALVMAT